MVPQPRRSKLPRFGLFPVRSPLLGESRLISFPPGTEMFQFSGLAPFRVTSLAACRVSPFGHSGITVRVQLPRAYRSLPRPSSPLDAKASTVCLIAFDLDLVGTTQLLRFGFPCYSSSSLQLSKSRINASKSDGQCGRHLEGLSDQARRPALLVTPERR